MMYWDGHMTTAGWIVAILWTVIIFALIAGAIYWFARSLSGGRATTAETEPSARQIIDRRLASGEISIEEHAALKSAIGEGTAGTPPVASGRPSPASG